MCPLRIILIFLSATLAGFFVLRNLKSQELITIEADNTDEKLAKNSTKVGGTVAKGFWTFVDMASGKYLWKNLVSSTKQATKPVQVSDY
ncbi:hypothetical protein Leryth_025589 [Lithospermum erythrorhizon]|nr:hypothetical protein Leryth_025589 [Lithospermum erythrorhizon]